LVAEGYKSLHTRTCTHADEPTEGFSFFFLLFKKKKRAEVEEEEDEDKNPLRRN
jgi:hypothetical protein